MKIAFLCGSFATAKDGVADYISRLSIELSLKGHTVIVVAINDLYTSTKLREAIVVQDIKIEILRIPSIWNNSVRFQIAKKEFDEFKPDWISFQFVPFAFHVKGLPITLASRLAKLAKDRKWHFMMHELWVGMAREENLKLKLWGIVQKYIIRALLNSIHPAAIHTQTRLYQAQLLKLGFNSGYLPLFGNIPPKNSSRGRRDEIKLTLSEKSEISFVIFGTIHANAPIDEFAKEAKALSQKHGIKFIMNFVGRCGTEQDRWVASWMAEDHKANVYGVQSPEKISEILYQSSVGLATTAFAVVEKSGSAAAMYDHGLPILCISKPWHPLGIKNLEKPSAVIEYVTGSLEHFISNIQEYPIKNNLETAANELEFTFS